MTIHYSSKTAVYVVHYLLTLIITRLWIVIVQVKDQPLQSLSQNCKKSGPRVPDVTFSKGNILKQILYLNEHNGNKNII